MMDSIPRVPTRVSAPLTGAKVRSFTQRKHAPVIQLPHCHWYTVAHRSGAVGSPFAGANKRAIDPWSCRPSIFCPRRQRSNNTQ